MTPPGEEPKKELTETKDEKDHLGLFQKFMAWVKAGARHSSAEQEHIQQAHDHPAQVRADCGMKMLKQADGTYRWFGWVSNKFRDRDTLKHPEGEIISEAAHKEFVTYLDAHPDKAPEWWSWHTPVRKARADWWDYADGFLTMSGPVPPGDEKGYLDMESPPGMSHGFYTLERDHAQGVIEKYRTFEVSDLPPEKAANGWTSFDVIQKELAIMFTPEKRDYLIKVLGEDRVKELETSTVNLGKSLEAAGVEYKEKGTPAAAGAPAPEIIEQVKALLNLDGLNKVIAELQAQNTALIEKQAMQEKAMAELKKSDDEKVAAIIAPKIVPMQWGLRPSESKDNLLTEAQKEKLKIGQSETWVSEAFAGLVK